MKVTILKNKRRPFPFFKFPSLVIFRRTKSYSIKMRFMFSESCFYKFNDADQYDVNKLFGFSIGQHHNNSFRFGWRPNSDLSKMEIVGYEYLNKLRIPTLPICEVKVGKWYGYEIRYNAKTNYIEYSVTSEDENFGMQHPVKQKNKIFIG